MEKFLFSYKNYKEVLDNIIQNNHLMDFSRVIKDKPQKYVLLRHDVEFSPYRALKMAEIEYEKGVQSSYFFQVTNNSYNILSKVNVDRVRSIHEMGHKVGLHFHLNGLTDISVIKERIEKEKELLAYYFGFEIDRFSFHRPPDFVLEKTINVPGLINTYDNCFFSYTKDPSQLKWDSAIKYIADSKWTEWSYTQPYLYPTKEFLNSYDKIQILVHPFVWSEDGLGILDNLKALLSEHRGELIQTIGNETKYVKEYVNEL